MLHYLTIVLFLQRQVPFVCNLYIFASLQKKKDPYRISVKVLLLLFLEFPNLNIQIPGFCCIADDVQNRVPVASGKSAA